MKPFYVPFKKMDWMRYYIFNVKRVDFDYKKGQNQGKGFLN